MMHAASPERILVIKPSAFGDVVQHVVVVRSLALAWPQSTVDWLVNSEFVPLLAGVSEVNAVIPFERSAMRGVLRLGSTLEILKRLVAFLRDQHYDAVLDMQGLLRSGLLALASGAAWRGGFRSAREMAWIGYNQRMDVSGWHHSADRSFALADALGRPLDRSVPSHLPVPPQQTSRVRELLGNTDQPVAVLVPGAQWKSKQWPPDHWRGLITHLLDHSKVVVALSGTAAERELAATVATGFDGRVMNLAGRTNLGELAALVNEAALVVAGDTGTMHLAVAQGRPVVALFGPSDPKLSGPWRRPEAVLRADVEVEHRMYRNVPDDRIMRLIRVEDVAARCSAVLTEEKARHGQE